MNDPKKEKNQSENELKENELEENELENVNGGVKTTTVCCSCGSRKGPFHGAYCNSCYKKRLKPGKLF